MKKLLLNIAWIVIVLITLASCTKIGRNITVKGRVLNPITGVGISGVEIKLLRSQNLQYNGGYKAIKKVISDENSNYEINAMRLGPIYLIPGEIGQNYSLGWDYKGHYYSMKKVDKGKVLNMDYHLVPYGELQINIKNTSCFDASDKVKIYFDGESPNSKTFMTGLLYEKDGCIDALDSPVKTTMGYKYFHWVSIKNNITTTYFDTVFVDENTVKVVEVFY